MIPKKEIEKIRDELVECQNPMFFFHDDADGLCSFLLLRRFKGEGDWRIVKQNPRVDEKFAGFITENNDKVFILDIALVDQEFMDKAKRPIIWVDHHMPQKPGKTKYFNPRVHDIDEYTPVSSICYEVAKQDIWIAAVGAIADYSMPDFFPGFKKKYPSLAGKSKKIDKVLYESELGKLIRIFSFSLKGKSDDVRKAIQIIRKVKEPFEILEPKDEEMKWVYKRYSEIDKEYQEHLKDALSKKYGKILVYVYKEKSYSFTENLANELIYKVPKKKLYIIGREKEEYMRVSLRSRGLDILPILNKALEQVDGYGGGHPYACGASVKKEDFAKFLELMEKGV